LNSEYIQYRKYGIVSSISIGSSEIENANKSSISKTVNK